MAALIVVVYAVYFVFIAVATCYVARILFTNSETFMSVIFNGRELLAMATNKLFETGFFLIAFGIGLTFLRTDVIVQNGRDMFEVLSSKTGAFTIFLGILLFGNLYMFFRGMKHRKRTPAPESTVVS